MPVITIDFESFYDTEYSLKKMSEVDYLLDPRFQAIMCAVKIDDRPSEVHIGKDAIAARFATIPWKNVAVCFHNARFDAAILGWHFGCYPPLYLDTLSMSRAVSHWTIGSSSLKSVAKYLGLPDKGDEIENTIGKRLEDFTGDELDRFANYCMLDNDLCHAIFHKLKRVFIPSELRVIDLLIRMFVQPQVELDKQALTEYLAQIRQQKQEAFDRVSAIDPKIFSSNKKFPELLTMMGVTVPYKTSPRTGLPIPALAKGDREFKELLADADLPLDVQAVLAARVGAKSTIEETRAEKFINLADKPIRAPVTLKFYGAKTGRPSGDGKLNWLNIKRGSPVRSAITAPSGFRIVHRDASQIEARMVSWLAGCNTILDAFKEGRDVYCEFATIVYGRTITKEDKLQRFIGKTSVLGLGYSCGWERFRHMLFIGSGGVSHKATVSEAKNIVYTYRSTYPEIPALWDRCSAILHVLTCQNQPVALTGKIFDAQCRAMPDDNLARSVKIGFNSLHLPNGLAISYPNLRTIRDEQTNQEHYVYDSPKQEPVKIYGGKVTENISQALARIIVTDIAVRVYNLTGHHPFLTTYDSLDLVVSETDAPWFDNLLAREFAATPSWAEGLPLDSEGGWGVSLADAEAGVNR